MNTYRFNNTFRTLAINEEQLLGVAGGTDTTETTKYAKGDTVYFYARQCSNIDKIPSGELLKGIIVGFGTGEYYIAHECTLYIATDEDIVRLA